MIKEREKQKTKEITQKKIVKKGEVRKNDVYEVEKLLDDRKSKGIWKIEVKWKNDITRTRELMKNIKKEQPLMVEDYMPELSKKNKVVTLKKKSIMKERAPKKKVVKKCKKEHGVRASYKMEEDIRYFTTNGKKKHMQNYGITNLL